MTNQFKDTILKQLAEKAINKGKLKMKKIIVTLLALAFVSCNQEVKSTTTTDSTKIDTVKVDSIKVDTAKKDTTKAIKVDTSKKVSAKK